MFDLEKAISEWRQQMLSAGIKTPVPLDELENHLRDDIEQKIKRGLSEQQAFDAAVQQVGSAKTLKTEFTKIRATATTSQMMQTVVILVALFGTVFGGAMVMPALGRWRGTGTLILWPIVVGTTVVAVGGWVTLYNIRQRRAVRGRNLISIGIVAAGAFYLVPLLQAFFLRKADLTGWIFCGFLAIASVWFYGACFRFNRNPSSASVH